MDRSVAENIIQNIEITRSEQHRFFVGLIGRTEFKLRVGDYRVIVNIVENRRAI